MLMMYDKKLKLKAFKLSAKMILENIKSSDFIEDKKGIDLKKDKKEIKEKDKSECCPK